MLIQEQSYLDRRPTKCMGQQDQWSQSSTQSKLIRSAKLMIIIIVAIMLYSNLICQELIQRLLKVLAASSGLC